MSDAGEPPGTAGRPMLTVLLHSGVGEVIAVCSRWFGGTKLGTGGLARAYAESVKRALATLPTEEKVRRVSVEVVVGYAAVDALQRALDELEGVTEAEAYGAEVRYRVALPESRVHELERAVARITAGEGRVRRG
jgi:putative IMPACT (imprinted ancient) family translation regulator